MQPTERLQRRLAMDPVDRPPNFDIIMGFGAHYIGQPLSRYFLDHTVLCEANMAVQDAFSLDILQAISDPYREAHDLGAKIHFPEDGLPLCQEPLLANAGLLSSLTALPPEGGQRMQDRIAAVRWFREHVADDIPVMGWVEGAMAEAADLRGVGTLLMDLYDRPEWVQELLDFCFEVEVNFARVQIEAGATMIGLGDAIASQVSPRAYRQYALPYEKRLFEAVHELGAVARLHICGDTSRILDDMVTTGADIIDIDWMVDIDAAARAFGEGLALSGNFDPVAVMLRGTPGEVRLATLDCARRGGLKSISNAGCEIPINTPHANLHAQAQALAEFGAER